MSTPRRSHPIHRDTAARRRFRGVPAEERQIQRRAQFIDAGFEIFGTVGFHAAGVRMLCNAAKLTERYFYESFDNRDALFDAVYEVATGRLRAAFLAALERATSDDGITLARAALRATLKTCRDDPRLTRILFVEALSTGAGEAAVREIRAYEQMIGQLISRLYPDLDKRSVDVDLLASGLSGSTISIIARWAVGGFRDPLERVLNHCALFYESVLHELQHRRGIERATAPARPAAKPDPVRAPKTATSRRASVRGE